MGSRPLLIESDVVNHIGDLLSSQLGSARLHGPCTIPSHQDAYGHKCDQQAAEQNDDAAS